MLLKNWFKSPDRWCQKFAAVDANGVETKCHPGNLNKICAMCLYGAVALWYPRFSEQTRIFRAIRQETGCESIVQWNDTHSFEEVVALVEKLEA